MYIYIQELLHDHKTTRSLRSTGKDLIEVSRSHTFLGDQCLQKAPKTYLFKDYYDSWMLQLGHVSLYYVFVNTMYIPYES